MKVFHAMTAPDRDGRLGRAKHWPAIMLATLIAWVPSTILAAPQIEVACGSYLAVTPGDLVGYPDATFAGRLTVRGAYLDLASGRNVPVRTARARHTEDRSSFLMVWGSGRPLLPAGVYRRAGMTADALSSNIIYEPVAVMALTARSSAGNKPIAFSVRRSFKVVAPTLAGVFSEDGGTQISYAAPGSRVMVKGTFFGNRPKVWVEQPGENTIRRRACRRTTAGLVYRDHRGNPSSMDGEVASPTYGMSQMVVQLPAQWPSTVDVRDIVLDNGVGRARLPFGSANPKAPNSYNVPSAFAYGTEQARSWTPRLTLPGGEPLANVRIDAYDRDPQLGGRFIASFLTDADGELPMALPVPTNVPRIFLRVGYVGYPDNVWLDVATGDITPAPQRPMDEAAFPEAVAMPGAQASGTRSAILPPNKYLFLSTYNSSSGVPNNLIVPGDVISQDLLDDINASLPEQRRVPLYHPQYLDPGLELNTVLDEQADVWITFVHEGAGYQNLLGFYTYPKGSPPATIDDITEFTVVFPNASLLGSGGGLRSGDKVLLGTFPADTVIGFFLIPNGWRANMTLLGNYVAYYSDPHLNPEANPDLRQHAILLWDEQRQLALLGFEDLNRATSGCDHDFNDAVFYITANPPTAINSSSVAEIDTPEDGDGDGVSDLFDDYPADPSRAFRNHYPAAGATMTVAYEDNWPELGDYDFNDLVLRCHFEYATNPQAQMVDLTGEFTILAIGAGYYNGFGFQMPFAPAAVASVSGHQVGAGYITLNPNGTEQGQAKAVVVVSDNVFDIIPKPPVGMVNTRAEDAYVEPQTLTVTIALNAPLATATNGPARFNHFMIGRQDRGVEIHAPGYPPTDLADPDLFGTKDDDTAPASGRYYVSPQTMPWALILPTDWSYPWEKTRLTHAYNRFGAWAESGGTLYSDWYATPPIFGKVYAPPAD